jgi:hypothetical protein
VHLVSWRVVSMPLYNGLYKNFKKMCLRIYASFLQNFSDLFRINPVNHATNCLMVLAVL